MCAAEEQKSSLLLFTRGCFEQHKSSLDVKAAVQHVCAFKGKVSSIAIGITEITLFSK